MEKQLGNRHTKHNKNTHIKRNTSEQALINKGVFVQL